ncbi:unnamed protein product [Boreogadus saida]
MLYRLYLAAMPFNGNAGRTQARTTSGKRMYRKGYIHNLKAVVFEEKVPNPRSARRSSTISDLSCVPSSDERSCGCINISLYPRAALKTRYWPRVSGNALRIVRTTQAGATTLTFLPK